MIPAERRLEVSGGGEGGGTALVIAKARPWLVEGIKVMKGMGASMFGFSDLHWGWAFDQRRSIRRSSSVHLSRS